MSKIAPSDEIHDELVNAYLEYFKTYDLWKERPSVRRYFSHQQCVRKIMKLAKLMNKQLQDEFYENRERPGVKLKREPDAQQEQDKGKDI